MSTHTCPACGRKFVRGVRRHVLGADGAIEARLVCKPCAFGRSIQIVVPAELNPCTVCASGRKATTCPACVNDAAHAAVRMALKPWAEFFLKMARVRKTQKHGDAPGLVAAAEYLNGARAVPVNGDGGRDMITGVGL